MKISTNAFSKNIPTASSNSFAVNRPTLSSNSFAKKIVSRGTNGWNGDNLTANEYGYDDLVSGIAYGVGEYGGIQHFRTRVAVTIIH